MTALAAPNSDVWLRMVLRRDGDDLVARCCMVKDADLRLFEVRVNLPETVRQAKALGVRLGVPSDGVSGFGSWLSKAVKKVAKLKIVKGVFKAVKTVANNPLTQLAVSVIPGGSLALASVNSAIKLVPGGSLAATVKNVSPKAFAALNMATQTLASVKRGDATRAAAKSAMRTVARGKAAASLVKSGKLPLAKAQPMLLAATKLRATLAKNGAALQKRVAHADAVKASLANMAHKARAGSGEAKVAASVIARTMLMQNQISAAAQRAQGGIEGFVITAQGGIKKAPKGRWLKSSALPMIQTLYQGSKHAPMRGAFTAVSGHAAWGGDRDPGNEIDGPLYPARYDDPDAWPNVVVGGMPPPSPRQERDAVILAWLKAQALKSKVGSHMASDLPPELSERSEDVNADMLGCSMNVGAFPSYLFTRKGLSHPVIRRRLAASLKAMPPKMRRRIITRLKAALYRMKVGGSMRQAYPSVGSHRSPVIGSHWGHWGHTSAPASRASGWTP